MTNVIKACLIQAKSGAMRSLVNLPRLKIVMDMDECMLCCEESVYNFDKVEGLERIAVTMEDNAGIMRVHLRPGLRQFLKEISSFSDVYVMTTAARRYARPAIKVLDPESNIFKRTWWREILVNGKDLTQLKEDYDENRTVLVDNMISNFESQPSNGILVKEFTTDPKDNHLQDVLALLKYLVDEPDVRTVLAPMYGKYPEAKKFIR